MEITAVKIFPFEPGDLQKNLKAYAEITVDDALILKGIKIFEKENGGIFITYPAIQGKDQIFHDIIIPTNPEIKKNSEMPLSRSTKRPGIDCADQFPVILTVL